MSLPPITLTTDFGTRDSYVAQMKGVILGIAPDAIIVDVTHDVPQGDVRQASWIVEQIADTFPAKSIHVIVIDPGVGSERRLVALEAKGQRFLVPDNGCLSEIVRHSRPERVTWLNRERFWRKPTSATFHGRDILAPTAAHWHRGCSSVEFGPEIGPGTLVLLPECEAKRDDRGWNGEVVAVDHFGNLITNLRSSALEDQGLEDCVVTIGTNEVLGIDRCYADRPEGSLVALFGSSGRLELAVRNGSAAALLDAGIGANVLVDLPESGEGHDSRDSGEAE
jgi:S-adenosylmethionine hydrolase